MQWEMTIECGSCGDMLEYECEAVMKGDKWVLEVRTDACSCVVDGQRRKELMKDRHKVVCESCGTKLGSIVLDEFESGDVLIAPQCPHCQEEAFQGQCCGCQGEAARRREESI